MTRKHVASSVCRIVKYCIVYFIDRAKHITHAATVMSRPYTVKTARERLARNLKDWRAKRGMSQDVLAEHSGLSRVFLSRIESALDTVSLDNIEKIAEVLKIDILDLLQH
ncbi:helix-turn-helix transcriptional regulator [Janthinobacterium sp.]|uniref:helix-turn-helix domain-containing protein n=1 Tax=Janthinobacterium sp. TaxID=1871054 RepID=UPI00338F7319